jgi:hypothetical protein
MRVRSKLGSGVLRSRRGCASSAREPPTPKQAAVTGHRLRAVGAAIREFRKVSRELREQAGFDEVVDEVTRPLREGLSGVEADVLRERVDTATEYPEAGPDDYNALPEHAMVYPDEELPAEVPVTAEAPRE